MAHPETPALWKVWRGGGGVQGQTQSQHSKLEASLVYLRPYFKEAGGEEMGVL